MQPTIVIEDNPNDILSTVTQRIQEKTVVYTTTAVKEIARIKGQGEIMGTGINWTCAFGDSGGFLDQVSSIAAFTFSSADAIVIAEDLGNLTNIRAEELYRRYSSEQVGYEEYKKRHIRQAQNKLGKLLKLLGYSEEQSTPDIKDAFKFE
jgi:predicted double-glycine peptidase